MGVVISMKLGVAVPPDWYELTSRSLSVTLRNSCWVSPALRAVSTACLMCWPVAHFWNSAGDALSLTFVNWKSWNVALPAPAPPVACVAVCLTPQLNDATSISPLCLSSVDSPLMPSIFRK